MLEETKIDPDVLYSAYGVCLLTIKPHSYIRGHYFSLFNMEQPFTRTKGNKRPRLNRVYTKTDSGYQVREPTPV